MSVRAHVVMGTKSFALRVAEAEIVLRGRVIDPAGEFVSKDRRTRRAFIEVAVLEELKGSVGVRVVRVAQDGHAVATYRLGDEALFFLKPIGRSRELRSIAVPGGPTHVSGQEHDEEFLVTSKSGPVLVAAVRAFIAAESVAELPKRVSLIRGATISLLTSGDDQLAHSALSSLVMAPNADWITAEDMPRVETTLQNRANSIGFRVALVSELARRGLVNGDERRLQLLATADRAELSAAIRAVSATPTPAVTNFLLKQLAQDSGATSEVASEAALALSASEDPRAVSALESALRGTDGRLRNAAIRSLGQMNTAPARSVLAGAAASHANTETRRLAEAELRKIRGRDQRGVSQGVR